MIAQTQSLRTSAVDPSPGSRDARASVRLTSLPRAIAQFVGGGLIAMLALSAILGYILFTTTNNVAMSQANEVTRVIAQSVIEPNLSDGLLSGDPAAVAQIDHAVRAGVLKDPLVRVKIWAPDGRIVYSDESRLIGSTYPFGSDELHALHSGLPDSGITDLSKPENRYEDPARQLVEVYVRVRTPGGQPLLYEDYLRFDSAVAGNRTLWIKFTAALVAALLLLELAQLPLAWSMARRMRAGQLEREALLRRAIDASDTERRRIARDLHDGAVQDLAASALGLAATARRLDAEGAHEPAVQMRTAAASMRESVRSLRTLLVDIYPTSLHREGLEPALREMMAPLIRDGVKAELLVSTEISLPQDVERAIYRVAQEALGNIGAHADASYVMLGVSIDAGVASLVIQDDGAGFDATHAPTEGHFGLQMLRDLAADMGGSFSVVSTPGRGTRVTFEVPV